MFQDTELILHPDGSIYHLRLLPSQIATTIITVGDPQRVHDVSKHFDKIDEIVTHREFVTHTGFLNKKHLTVLSTGIGTDNIDIVLNELDALVNNDFQTRMPKANLTRLQLFRIGTSGALQADIDVDSFLLSEYALGLDGLMNFYDYTPSEQEDKIGTDLEKYIKGINLQLPIEKRIFAADETLFTKMNENSAFGTGITATCTGFYAPQGRTLRAKSVMENYLQLLSNFRTNFQSHFDTRITNFEMETAGIYGLARVLGHQAISCNAILANRITGRFSQQPQKTVQQLIELVLEKLTN